MTRSLASRVRLESPEQLKDAHASLHARHNRQRSCRRVHLREVRLEPGDIIPKGTAGLRVVYVIEPEERKSDGVEVSVLMVEPRGVFLFGHAREQGNLSVVDQPSYLSRSTEVEFLPR